VQLNTSQSVAQQIGALPEDERKAILQGMDKNQLLAMQYDWKMWGRPKQFAPVTDWSTWLILAGRGWGKTRTGAECIRHMIEKEGYKRLALVGATAADARDILVEGESGILAISPPWFRPQYKPSKRRLIWPNGAVATVFSADKPDRLRGPNHDAAWADELAAWRNPEAWDMLMLTLRVGKKMTRVVVTTTPKPLPHIKDLIVKPGVHVTRGTTYENLDNLSPRFKEEVLAAYQGTRLGRQEIDAEILDDAPGALWKRSEIDKHRVTRVPKMADFLAQMKKIVVGVDPEASSTEQSAETGIVVCGEGLDGEGYVLGDFTLRGTPGVWGKQAVSAYYRMQANALVGEANNGGEMVGFVLQQSDKNLPFKLVYASRGKQTRAEPVATMAEQGRIHHVGYFPELEDQLCQWTPGAEKSPDRLDAMVWAFSELFVTGVQGGARKVKGHH